MSLHAFLTELTRTTLQREAEQNPELARTVIRRLVDPVQEGVVPIVSGTNPAQVDGMSVEDMQELLGRLTRSQQRWALCERQIALPESERQPIPWSAVDKAEIITDRNAMVPDYLIDPGEIPAEQYLDRFPWAINPDGRSGGYEYGRWRNWAGIGDRQYIYNEIIDREFSISIYGRLPSEFTGRVGDETVQGTPAIEAYGDLWGIASFPGGATELVVRQIDTRGRQSLVLYAFSNTEFQIEHLPCYGGVVRQPPAFYPDCGVQNIRHTRITDAEAHLSMNRITMELALARVGRAVKLSTDILTWSFDDTYLWSVWGFWNDGVTYVNSVKFRTPVY